MYRIASYIVLTDTYSSFSLLLYMAQRQLL
jgi:hypothetical protein